MTTKELVQVAQWIDEGVCEYRMLSTSPFKPYPFPNTFVEFNVSSNEEFSNYRRKPTTTKFRPWRPEEVPVGALITNDWIIKEQKLPFVILGYYHYNKLCLIIMSNTDIDNNYAYLSDLITSRRNYRYSLDHGVTWKLCGVKTTE